MASHHTSELLFPKWFTRFLRFAAFYNMGWGVLIMTRPEIYYQSFYLIPVEAPFWMAPFGGLVMLFGIFYFQASYHPLKYQNLLYLGLLSKILGPGVHWFLFMRGPNVNYLNYYLSVIFNDLLWILPLYIICRYVYLKSRS